MAGNKKMFNIKSLRSFKTKYLKKRVRSQRKPKSKETQTGPYLKGVEEFGQKKKKDNKLRKIKSSEFVNKIG